MVYVYHLTPHCSTHIKNPETRINTEKIKFQKIYRLLLTFTPAAADTLIRYFRDTESVPADYDLILTGDLGYIGSELLNGLLADEKYNMDGLHNDCGMMIYDRKKQDVHAGGSGCGCSAAVLCGRILPELKQGTLSRVLFCATGALMSPTTVFQGESIPAVAHLVRLENKKA